LAHRGRLIVGSRFEGGPVESNFGKPVVEILAGFIGEFGVGFGCFVDSHEPRLAELEGGTGDGGGVEARLVGQPVDGGRFGRARGF